MYGAQDLTFIWGPWLVRFIEWSPAGGNSESNKNSSTGYGAQDLTFIWGPSRVRLMRGVRLSTEMQCKICSTTAAQHHRNEWFIKFGYITWKLFLTSLLTRGKQIMLTLLKNLTSGYEKPDENMNSWSWTLFVHAISNLKLLKEVMFYELPRNLNKILNKVLYN